MQFQREIQRLLAVLLLGLVAVVLSATYWVVSGPETLLQRDDNPRRVEAEAAILRGGIYDRNGELLAHSLRQRIGTREVIRRSYLRPEVYGTIGYFSLRYGVGGIEAAFDAILRGDTLPVTLASAFNQGVLHQPPVGSDIRLTLDLMLQRAVQVAMQNQRGAAVLLSNRGEVLALVSLPGYDPNTLDARWATLATAPDNPFFNRALQGRYQPGGLLQIPLMTAALIAGAPVNQVIDNAARSITLQTISTGGEAITLDCTARPPANRLTTGEAFAFTCPGPFADLYAALGEQTLRETFALFGLGQGHTITGFTPAPPVAPLETLTLADVLGQGALTLSPLDAAVMVATVINEGNAPQPTLLAAQRAPGATNWTSAGGLTVSSAVTTGETARRLQTLLRDATVSGSARRAARANIQLGGQVARAYSGEFTHTWFVGYALAGQNQGVALALVLEDYDDPDGAAEIGGRILEAAHRHMTSDSPPVP